MNALILEVSMCVIFLFGNTMHTLLTAWQHVQVNKKFPGYGAWLAAFWIPEFVRTIFQLVLFAIFLPTLMLIDFHPVIYGYPFELKFNMGWAWMGGFMSDVIIAIAAQKLADKYPKLKFLVAQIPPEIVVAAADPMMPPLPIKAIVPDAASAQIPKPEVKP